MKRLILNLLIGLFLVAGVVYAGDYLWTRYRLPHREDAFDSVTITPLYVIHEKNNKVEYQLAQPRNEVCVRSLFPHFGYAPCWYVRKHMEKRIDI
jgi:hypothetical protein